MMDIVGIFSIKKINMSSINKHIDKLIKIKEYTLYGIIPLSLKRNEFGYNVPNKFWMLYFKLRKIELYKVFYRSYGRNYFHTVYNRYKNKKVK